MQPKETNLGDGTLAVEVAGKKLACLICGNTAFHERDTLLNTRAATFFKMDWANASATNYVCTACCFVHWFLPD